MKIEHQINSLGEAVKFKRALLDLSQRKLACKLGVDYTYVSKIENDKVTPSSELIKELEEILEFQEGVLFAIAGLPSAEIMQVLVKVLKEKGDFAVIQKLSELLDS